MNILDYLDKESPEVSRALTHGFRRGDADAIGRAVLEEIKARQALVRVLNERLILCEKEFPGIKAKLLDLDSTVKGVENVVESAPAPVGETDRVTDARLDAIDERISIIATDRVTDARLDAIDERIGIIASGLVTIVNSLSS